MEGDINKQEENPKKGHSEFELTFVLILIGLLGIAFLAWYIGFGGIFNGHRELSNEEMTSANYSDVPGRNIEVLALGIHPEKGRYYAHPDTGVTLYINTVQECEEACLEMWKPYLAPEASTTDAILGTTYKEDADQTQYTLNSYGLYTYKLDTKPGQTLGEGIDGVWWLARP